MVSSLFRFISSCFQGFCCHSIFFHVSILIVKEIIFILFELLVADVWMSTEMARATSNVFSGITLLGPKVSFLVLIKLQVLVESIRSLLVTVNG